jgi:2-isopropylmalate synthase
MRRIDIFDTTLRDGEQAPGNSMAPEVKMELFHLIATTGVSYVEAGFPTASPQDFETVAAIAAGDRDVAVTAFARAARGDIDQAMAALGGNDGTQLQLLLTGSEIHARHKRRMTLPEIMKETEEAVTYARSLGATDLALGLEDSSRGGEDYLRRLVELGVGCGGTTVVLADTVGQAVPSAIRDLVTRVRSWVGPDIRVSLHCHNDLGLALANALAGVAAGADVVQTTFCGIGERTGNTAVEELATVLHYKAAEYGATTGVDLRRARETCDRVLAALNLSPWKHKPIIGRYAFSTAAGVHASGLENDPITYEYVQPDLFGRKREVVLNRVSGRANLRMRLSELGLECSPEHLDKLYSSFVNDPDPQRFNEEGSLRELFASVA